MRDGLTCHLCLQTRACETALTNLQPICMPCAFRTATPTTHDDEPGDPATDHSYYR